MESNNPENINIPSDLEDSERIFRKITNKISQDPQRYELDNQKSET